MTGLILIGLLPFAGLGIVFGHLLTPDSIGPVMGGTTALLAILGGTWFPITSGAMKDIGEALPSYWLVQAGHVALGGKGWTTAGWVVITVWTVGAAVAARLGLPPRHQARLDARGDVASSLRLQPLGGGQHRLAVGRLEHDLDLGPVGREARVGADRDAGPAHGGAGEQVRRSRSRAFGTRAATIEIGCSPRSSSAYASNIASISDGRPGSTQTFPITNPGAPPCGFRSGRLPTGSCAQRAA